MSTFILVSRSLSVAFAACLAVSQSVATKNTVDRKVSEDPAARSSSKLRPHVELRQTERGEPSDDRRVVKEMGGSQNTPSVPQNFWEFEKLEEESDKNLNKTPYDSSKETRGDSLRETLIGDTVTEELRESGFWDRETGQKSAEEEAVEAPRTLTDSPAEAALPQTPPEPKQAESAKEAAPPVPGKSIRDAGEWPVLTEPTGT
jgi:hypothetical protein